MIATDKGVVRLLPAGVPGAVQFRLFGDEEQATPRLRGRSLRPQSGKGVRGEGQVSDAALRTRREATTLDRVHAAMLLQKAGRTNALRALLAAETERGPDFLRLANALSALYPRDSEEKRLVDAMLLAVPRT